MVQASQRRSRKIVRTSSSVAEPRSTTVSDSTLIHRRLVIEWVIDEFTVVVHLELHRDTVPLKHVADRVPVFAAHITILVELDPSILQEGPDRLVQTIEQILPAPSRSSHRNDQPVARRLIKAVDSMPARFTHHWVTRFELLNRRHAWRITSIDDGSTANRRHRCTP